MKTHKPMNEKPIKSHGKIGGARIMRLFPYLDGLLSAHKHFPIVFRRRFKLCHGFFFFADAKCWREFDHFMCVFLESSFTHFVVYRMKSIGDEAKHAAYVRCEKQLTIFVSRNDLHPNKFNFWCCDAETAEKMRLERKDKNWL